MSKVKIKEYSEQELVELTRGRQLYPLAALTKSFKFPHNNITYWEELTCTGYNPDQQRLEAVINIKRETGYLGKLCSRASKEYVRFFVDFKDGAGFRNMGYTSFKVADISERPVGPQHPLSYVVYLYINDEHYRRFLVCDKAVIPTIRAVLSWNTPPSINPHVSPHYGNHLDADIQLNRPRIIYWKDAVTSLKINDLSKLIDPGSPVELKEPLVADAKEIHKLNKEAGIPDHRTFYATIGSLLNSEIDFRNANSVFNIDNFDNYGINVSQYFDYFNGEGKDADVSYEELTCVGLHTATDRLGAVIHIKKRNGYNGNLCTKGSMEHVAFWADWNNNGVYDRYLGTVSLNVHDIHNIPDGGLYYNVLMPFSTARHLRQCGAPNIIRIRAVLSWEALPSTTNPNNLNLWGNYKDALVQLRPSNTNSTGIQGSLFLVGGVDRDEIDFTEHLFRYRPNPIDEHYNRPWGGNITFHGNIDRHGFNGTIKYRISFKKFGASDSTYQSVSFDEHIEMKTYTPFGVFTNNVHQTVADGWFRYDQIPDFGVYNEFNYLASWNASGMTDGHYTIKFEFTDELGNPVTADEFSIVVCNKRLITSLTANTAVDLSSDVDLVIDGGDCHSYTPGAPMINGHLRTVHPFFARWSLVLEPATHTHGTVPAPTTRGYFFWGDNGDANAPWTLNTAPLDPCGYTVTLTATTRVINNSDPNNFNPVSKSVGFAKLP